MSAGLNFLLLACAAAAYSLVVSFAYVDYLHPTMAYAGFGLVAREGWTTVSTFVLSLLPLLARTRALSGPSAVVAMIYLLSFVPSVWVLHHALHRDEAELLSLQVMLCVCMSALFFASRLLLPDVRFGLARVPASSVSWLTAVIVGLIALAHRDTLRFVGFGEVYDLRFEARDLGVAAWIGYLTMWCNYAFIPFLLARGLRFCEGWPIIVGVAGCVVIYMAHGAKSAILIPAILVTLHLLFRLRTDYLASLLAVGAVGLAALLWLVPDSGIGLWARAVVLMRIIGSSGWTTTVYYEFFSDNGFTYWSHVGAINAITGNFQYGSLELGQLLGLEYSGSEQANFNAGFWASDGMAAMGLWGLPIATLGVAGYLVCLKIVSRGRDPLFVALWLCGYSIALLNVPLSTAMVSGGGVLVLLMLLFVQHEPRTNGSRYNSPPSIRSLPMSVSPTLLPATGGSSR